MPPSLAREALTALLPFGAGMLGLFLAPSVSLDGPASVLVAIASAAAVALAQTRQRRRRMERIEGVARAMGRGNFRAVLAVGGRDRLGTVEQALGEMQEAVGAQVRRLAEAGERTHGILRAMIEGVVVLSAAGDVVLMNERAAALFGLPGDVDHRGRHLIELSRDPQLQELVRDALAPGSVRTVREISMQGATTHHLRVSVARVGAGASVPFAAVLVFHDMTEVKRLETMRRDFVANVSHELRTPLTAIRGYAETLLSGDLRDTRQARQFLAVIDRHAERLSRLIDDLLTLSDLELGRTAIKREEVPIEGLVADVVELVSAKAAQQHVSLVTELPPDLPSLRGDPDRLQQVLINLADNAVKYTPRGGTVTIGARGLDDGPGRAVELVVRDTGIGIPAGDLPRLTERFYRVDKARSRELGGTGLGLAIVKHIVQAHGGSLDISSAVNHGTTVRLLLPASEAAVPG